MSNHLSPASHQIPACLQATLFFHLLCTVADKDKRATTAKCCKYINDANPQTHKANTTDPAAEKSCNHRNIIDLKKERNVPKVSFFWASWSPGLLCRRFWSNSTGPSLKWAFPRWMEDSCTFLWICKKIHLELFFFFGFLQLWCRFFLFCFCLCILSRNFTVMT